jgi:hypothetical protein
VSVEEPAAGSGNRQVKMTNNTTGEKYQSTVQYASSESAEGINLVDPT